MTREEALDKLCHSYSGYFDVVRHEEPKGYILINLEAQRNASAGAKAF